jgi:hypothetical protein
MALTAARVPRQISWRRRMRVCVQWVGGRRDPPAAHGCGVARGGDGFRVVVVGSITQQNFQSLEALRRRAPPS